MSKRPLSALTLCSLTLGLASPAQALAPMIGYSGRLLDAGGQPATGDYAMTFRLYSTATGGDVLFEEVFSGAESVSVSQGYFWVLLANNQATTMTLDEITYLHDQLFLEMEVEGGLLEPRQPIAPVPWSLSAGLAQGTSGSGGHGSGDRDTLGSLNCNNGQVPVRIAGVWACGEVESPVAQLSCAANQVVKWSGSAWDCADDLQGLTQVDWASIIDVPPGLVDLGAAPATACASGDVLSWSGAGWVCQAPSALDWADVSGIPPGLVDVGGPPSTACINGAVPTWNGTAWSCGPRTYIVWVPSASLVATRYFVSPDERDGKVTIDRTTYGAYMENGLEMVAPFPAPYGVTIQDVTVFYKDDSSLGNLEARLYYFNSTTIPPVVFASVDSSEDDESIHSMSFPNAFTLNAGRMYVLSFRVRAVSNGNTLLWGSVSSDIQVRGVRITYEANGF